MTTSLSLYRQFLREVKQLPVPAIRSKLTYNCRELFELHRLEQDPGQLQRLQEDVNAASRLLIWLRRLPKVSRCSATNFQTDSFVHGGCVTQLELQDKFETLFKQFD